MRRPLLTTLAAVSAVLRSSNLMQSRVMYIENKASGLSGPARIGRVTFSKTGKSLYYRGRRFQSLKGRGFKANYFDVATGEEYWISGCKQDGSDRLYGGITEVDADVRDEYWATIRLMPQCRDRSVAERRGKYSG